MNNCSDRVSDEQKNQILSQYMSTLRISGYDELYRFQILNGILCRIKQIEEDIAQGNRVRYRSKDIIEA